jgi:tetratricopeptide (TPR) repeat protein
MNVGDSPDPFFQPNDVDHTEQSHQPNPAQLLHNKAKAALALGEIYEANILIRKALELDASENNIALAKEIKHQIGLKTLAKAQQYFEKGRRDEAYDEAKKVIQLMGESAEAQEIIDQIDQKNQRSKSKGKSVWILIILLFVGGIAAMLVYYQSFSEEQAAWSEANQEASIPSYQHFLEKFPKGKFGSMAREALKTLYEKDEQLWNSALNPPDKSNLGRYLLAMEAAGGMHIEDAKLMIDSFDFDIALRAGSLEALQGYISAHPNGVYFQSAKNMLTTLVTPEEKTSLIAYLQTFYELFANGSHKELLSYFDESTPRFMDKTQINKADLYDLFQNNQDGVVEEEITIDTASFSVSKDSSGTYRCKYQLDSHRKAKKEIEVPKKKGKLRLFKTETIITHYYANQSVTVMLNREKKIQEYAVRVLSSRKETE